MQNHSGFSVLENPALNKSTAFSFYQKSGEEGAPFD
jgi:hypothetical protein